jgi:hypothetical protein
MPSGPDRSVQFVRRLRPLSEAECYARCYGTWEANVTIVSLEPRQPRFETTVTGEELRRRLEEMLDSRVVDETAEAA